MGKPYVAFLGLSPLTGWYVVEEFGDELHRHAGPFETMADAEQWLHDNTEPEEAK